MFDPLRDFIIRTKCLSTLACSVAYERSSYPLANPTKTNSFLNATHFSLMAGIALFCLLSLQMLCGFLSY
ncbi:hypothetical protein, partial [uncultured Helicobacter sp.]|uniref:hypothetical protein n=1 Tax=uncultured Helicobacter sp. TaxID=175537 RepID=UPI0026EB7E5A